MEEMGLGKGGGWKWKNFGDGINFMSSCDRKNNGQNIMERKRKLRRKGQQHKRG